jgi:hypothetical protein
VVWRWPPRAKRSFTRGVSGPTARWVAEVAKVVGSCHQAVIAWGVIYNLSSFVFLLFAKNGFPRLSGDPYGCPLQ